jgi:DNA-binding FadR family transcriptional regulator
VIKFIRPNNQINPIYIRNTTVMARKQLSSEFLDYLAASPAGGERSSRLPSLSQLSQELQVSVSTLREQMEVARALGFVEARPRTGIRRLPYTFFPAVRQSLSYAIALDQEYFHKFADLRRNVETCYWYQAVSLLTPQDHETLRALMARAWEKLRGTPIEIPQAEHRELHLTIYRRLDNPFVTGVLEAYWEAYEAVGLNLYADYFYLEEVWGYHQRMVNAICKGDMEVGYNALLVHTDLLRHRAVASENGVTVIMHDKEF